MEKFKSLFFLIALFVIILLFWIAGRSVLKVNYNKSLNSQIIKGELLIKTINLDKSKKFFETLNLKYKKFDDSTIVLDMKNFDLLVRQSEDFYKSEVNFIMHDINNYYKLLENKNLKIVNNLEDFDFFTVIDEFGNRFNFLSPVSNY